MKLQEKKALKDKSLQELRQLAQEIHSEIVKIRLEKTNSKAKNVHTEKKKRNDLARVLTFIRQKELSL